MVVDVQKLLEQEKGGLWRISPATFAAQLSQNEPQPWKLAPHLELLGERIMDTVANGGRLIVNMPPRHGKSELISKWVPVWFLDLWPEKRIINTGHGSDFAEEWGRKARDLVKQHEGKLSFAVKMDSKAAGRWNTTKGGGMVATGVGGQITGRGADLFVVDDAIKDHAEASSLTERDFVWDWWRNTAVTRLEPGAGVIILMTRWHEDDLVGRLLKEAAAGTGEDWEVLNLPAISFSPDDPSYKPDPLGRVPGEALWPTRWPIEALRKKMRGVSPEAWAAQYQGVPASLAAVGNVYSAFDEHRNVRPAQFDPRRPVVLSTDFNVDPMCWTVCQYTEEHDTFTYLTNELKRTIYVLDEICLPNTTTQEMCNEFCERTQDWCRKAGGTLKVQIFGDRSGKSRHTVGSTDYTVIKDFFRGRYGYSVTHHVGNSNPAVRDRVNAVNAMLCNALGEVRTVIDPRCRELVRDFREVKWKRDSGGNTTGQIDKSDSNRTHVSDAYGYFVERVFGLKNKAGTGTGILQ